MSYSEASTRWTGHKHGRMLDLPARSFVRYERSKRVADGSDRSVFLFYSGVRQAVVNQQSFSYVLILSCWLILSKHLLLPSPPLQLNDTHFTNPTEIDRDLYDPQTTRWR